MTSQSSGGSGSGLPGVTGDGLTPGGLVVAGGVRSVQQAVQVGFTADIALVSGTFLSIPWNRSIIANTAMHSTSVNPDQFLITSPGWYSLSAQAVYYDDPAPAAPYSATITFRLNGANNLGYDTWFQQPGEDVELYHSVPGTKLAIGDIVTCEVRQRSGSTVHLDHGECYMTVLQLS